MPFKRKHPLGEPAPASEIASDARRPEWNLPIVMKRLSELAPALETKDIEPALVRARLADHYRDLGLEPVPPTQFDRMIDQLNSEAWRRLALAVGTLDHPDIRSALAVLPTTAIGQVAKLAELAMSTDALSLTLLRQSEVRIEEFARHFASHLGVFWDGETAEASKQRLHLLDYKRLLAEAENAKRQAEERMEYLRKKQAEESARRRPRGKQ